MRRPMIRRPSRESLSASRRRLAFERCEDRLALDGSAVIDSLVGDEASLAHEGGTVSVAGAANGMWAYGDFSIDLIAAPTLANGGVEQDATHDNLGTRVTGDLPTHQQPFIWSDFDGVEIQNHSWDTYYDSDVASDRLSGFLIQSDGVLILVQPPEGGDGLSITDSEGMKWVPTAPAGEPEGEGGRVNVAPVTELPLAWAIAQAADETPARPGLAPQPDAEILRMRAIHFEVAHAAPSLREAPTTTMDGAANLSQAHAIAPLPESRGVAPDTLAMDAPVASAGPHVGQRPVVGGGELDAAPVERVQLLIDGDAPAEVTPAAFQAALRPTDAPRPEPASTSAAERDAAFAALDSASMPDLPAEPAPLIEGWRRESIGVGVVALLAGEWALTRRRPTSGAAPAETEWPARAPRRCASK